MAQIGQRLIDTAANKLANEFFGKFNEILNPADDNAESKDSTNDNNQGISQKIWITILIILASLSTLIWYSLS